MFKNYLKLTIRDLLRNKGYTFVNLTGLAIGIACCLLILLFVQDEMTHDAFHEKADQLYRVVTSFPQANKDSGTYNATPDPLAPAAKAEFAEIEATVRLMPEFLVVNSGDKSFYERVVFADPDIFHLFTFPLLAGDAATALAGANNIVISREMAIKYFDEDAPLGKSLRVKLGNDFRTLVVTGVTSKIPGNSSIRFDFLLPYEKIKDVWGEEYLQIWFKISTYTFALLRTGVSAETIETRLPAIVDKYMGFSGTNMKFVLQPLRKIHLDARVKNASGMTPLGAPISNPKYSYILLGIAFGVLFIACINYITLSLGRSASRAREIGVRKVAGATRTQLMQQFLGEAVLLSFLSLLLALALAEISLPAFDALIGKKLSFLQSLDSFTLIALAGMMLLVGLAGGWYPAMILSGFNSIKVLQGPFKVKGKNTISRILVVVQYALSIILISSTAVMASQLQFLRTQSLGFKQENLVIVRNFSSGQPN